MKKFLKIAAICIITAAVAFGCYALYKFIEGPQVAISAELPENDSIKLKDCNFAELTYDIYVGEPLSCICDEVKTGFDVTVGPTGWPVGSKLEWEVALFEGSDAYYARLILHEYMLWWSWDDPYIAVKIPKCYVNGDPRNDEKFRWQMLWDITYATYRSYNYNPYIHSTYVRAINGHTVTFGYYGCHYEKYLVISDTYTCPW